MSINPNVTVVFNDGSTKILRLTSTALIEVEEHLGFSPIWALSQPQHASGFKFLRAMLWAGMKGAGSPLSLKAVGDLMDPGRFQYYVDAIVSMLQRAGLADKPQDGVADDPTKAALEPSQIGSIAATGES